MRKHGGQIAFRSACGQPIHGTTFSMFFPIGGVKPNDDSKPSVHHWDDILMSDREQISGLFSAKLQSPAFSILPSETQ